MLRVVMLSVIMLSVIMLSVAAPFIIPVDGMQSRVITFQGIDYKPFFVVTYTQALRAALVGLFYKTFKVVIYDCL